eukprot:1094272_1
MQCHAIQSHVHINPTMRKIKERYPTQTCIHPYLYSSKDRSYCYLIEKGPSYMNSPWVAAIYSTLMPQTKVIGIIRNPIHHVWSNYWAFNQIKSKKRTKIGNRFACDRNTYNELVSAE